VVPFPEERKKIDIGDFYSDARKIEGVLGWKSTTTFTDGLTRTIDYYRKHKDRYL
jgi:UDP-glucose 4-epimerase